ncbi:MAG: phospholipase A [Gammaproteobacteria bacterium]|nr:phospholipase A [Gammaproteobacteria bacterium]
MLSIFLAPFAPLYAAVATTEQEKLAQEINQAADNETQVEGKLARENKIPNYFGIAFYKPTYVMPYYYTGSPYKSIYENNTPGNEGVSRTEIKYQLSFKVPVWKNMFHSFSSLYIAYSQLSYWQAYDHDAFFRETDYEPEVFIANEFNLPLTSNWKLNFINLGASHQSNGFGNDLERSWNRVYLEAIASADNWMVSVKPWLIIHDESFREHNPNIANYLGYGQVTVAYKIDRQVISLMAHNFIEGGGKHPTVELAYSFPITKNFNGFVQFFSGYGQSLIEYNHHTNSAGIGIALSNWI